MSQRLLEMDKRQGLELEMTKIQLALDQALRESREWKEKYDFVTSQGIVSPHILLTCPVHTS